jgi:hypothetical protein
MMSVNENNRRKQARHASRPSVAADVIGIATPVNVADGVSCMVRTTTPRGNRNARSNGKAIADAIAQAPVTPAPVAPINPAPVDVAPVAPVDSTPDYANMATPALLSAFWSFIGDVRADAIVSLVNATGGNSATLVTGELSALYSVALGLRKAYGRGVKSADVIADLPSVTIPDGFNPTFALYLSAAKLRADDANERKIAADVKSAIRAKIRDARKLAK